MEDHQGHSRQGNESSGNEVFPEFFFVEQAGKQLGEHRCGTDQQGNIGGLCDSECRILGDEVKRSSEYAGQKQQGFVPQAVGEKFFMGDCQQTDIGNRETVEKDFCGSQS